MASSAERGDEVAGCSQLCKDRQANQVQAQLARLVGCTNNSISHIEVAQTKVSLPMLMRIARVLEKDLDFFLRDTPYVSRNWVIDREIANKLDQCNASTLLAVSKILDVLLDYQQSLNTEQNA